MNAYVARILEVNATLHVINELNPDALLIATELDAERKNGTTRGPLRTYMPTRLLFVRSYEQFENKNVSRLHSFPKERKG